MTAATALAVSRRIAAPGLAGTRRFASRMAARARPGDVIGLCGPLGAGKTTFARAFITEIARLSGAHADEVPSPTFTLVQIYEFARATVYHFDLYRLARPEEAWELGIEEAFADGVTLIEWPERLGALLPADRFEVRIHQGAAPDERILELSGHGACAARIAEFDHDA